MFCTKCGTQNLDTDRFCRNCSAQLVVPRPAPRFQQGPTQPTYPPQPSQTPSPYPGYSGHPVPQAPYGDSMTSQQNKASGQAIAAMVLSICALALCCFPTGIIGTLLGKMEMNAIREGRAPKAGETFAKVGFYVGIISIIIDGIFYIVYFLSMLRGF